MLQEKPATRRRLQQEGPNAAAAVGKLSVQCQALVSLAEPGNLYKAFQDTFTATSVATQAQYLEQKLHLAVSPSFSCVAYVAHVCQDKFSGVLLVGRTRRHVLGILAGSAHTRSC